MKFIYRFDDPITGKCLYVGQSFHPVYRNKQHQYGRRAFATGTLVIIRQVTEKDALRVEAQIIKAYQRRGEAEYNWPHRLRAELSVYSLPELDTLARAAGRRQSAEVEIDGHAVRLWPVAADQFQLFIGRVLSNSGKLGHIKNLIAEWSEGKRRIAYCAELGGHLLYKNYAV